jgi:hypothetical protein
MSPVRPQQVFSHESIKYWLCGQCTKVTTSVTTKLHEENERLWIAACQPFGWRFGGAAAFSRSSIHAASQLAQREMVAAKYVLAAIRSPPALLSC